MTNKQGKIDTRGNWLKMNTLVGKLGAVIANIKRKDKDLYDVFADVCTAAGKKPYEVVMEFMAFYVEQGGVSVYDIGALKRRRSVGEQQEEISAVQQLADMVKKSIVDNVSQQVEFQKNLQEISLNYANQLQMLNNTIAELRQQLQEINYEKELIKKQKQDLEIAQTQLELIKKKMAEKQRETEKSKK